MAERWGSIVGGARAVLGFVTAVLGFVTAVEGLRRERPGLTSRTIGAGFLRATFMARRTDLDRGYFVTVKDACMGFPELRFSEAGS